MIIKPTRSASATIFLSIAALIPLLTGCRLGWMAYTEGNSPFTWSLASMCFFFSGIFITILVGCSTVDPLTSEMMCSNRIVLSWYCIVAGCLWGFTFQGMYSKSFDLQGFAFAELFRTALVILAVRVLVHAVRDTDE